LGAASQVRREGFPSGMKVEYGIEPKPVLAEVADGIERLHPYCGTKLLNQRESFHLQNQSWSLC